MTKTLPDKWIRKAIYTAINNISVDGVLIPCFDTRVAGNSVRNYILLTTQSNTVDKRNKCSYDWDSNILIEVFTSHPINTGSRLLADNIVDKIRQLTDNLSLDVASGLEILTQIQSFPNDLESTSTNQIIYRKFIRIEFLIE